MILFSPGFPPTFLIVPFQSYSIFKRWYSVEFCPDSFLYSFSICPYPSLGCKWLFLVADLYKYILRLDLCEASERGSNYLPESFSWMFHKNLKFIGLEKKTSLSSLYSSNLFLLHFLPWSIALLSTQLYEPDKLECPSLLPLPNWSCHQIWLFSLIV